MLKLVTSLFIATLNFSPITLLSVAPVTLTTMAMSNPIMNEDSLYPGTAVNRMNSIRDRVKELDGQLNGNWEDVRLKILSAGGLKDLRSTRPGEGYTGHSFNDFNHCALTAMKLNNADNENRGKVSGIHFSNALGNGIRIASLSDHGDGGSWSTCIIGAGNEEGPSDVAHLQFQSRVAFYMVWSPNDDYSTFVLIDDDGKYLAKGKPSGEITPTIRERAMNYKVFENSKYSKEALNI